MEHAITHSTYRFAAAYVADGATGAVRELERAIGGIAIEWYGERTLAIAGDHGVSLVALDGSAAVQPRDNGADQ